MSIIILLFLLTLLLLLLLLLLLSSVLLLLLLLRLLLSCNTSNSVNVSPESTVEREEGKQSVELTDTLQAGN